DKILVAVPVHGTWGIEVDAQVHAKFSLGPIHKTTDFPIKIEVTNLSMHSGLVLDDTDLDRPLVKKVIPPDVTFHVKISSSRAGVEAVLAVLSPLGDFFAHRLAKNALDGL